MENNTQILYFYRERDIVLEEWNREIWSKRLSGGLLTYNDKFTFSGFSFSLKTVHLLLYRLETLGQLFHARIKVPGVNC